MQLLVHGMLFLRVRILQQAHQPLTTHMTRFLLIRHATTDAVGITLSGRSSGVLLNQQGLAEAKTLAERLKHLHLDHIYSSSLERAMDTAKTIGSMLQLNVAGEDAFLELDFGAWTAQSFSQLEGTPAFGLFNSFRSGSPVPGGESMLAAQARFVGGMDSLYQKHPGQNIAIVSHSDMIKAALAYYAGIPIDLMQRLEIYPASVSIIERYPDTVRIKLLNHTGPIAFS